MVAGLLFLLLLGALVLALTNSAETTKGEQQRRSIALRVGVVLLLNTVGFAIFVFANQLLLNALGFIELPMLIAITATTLVMSYGFLAVASSRFVSRRVSGGFGKSARLLLPLLVMGLAVVRYYVLDYCASASPADPRCESVFQLV